jgi:hypothetical protein
MTCSSIHHKLPPSTKPLQNPMMKTSTEAFVFLTSCVKISIEILAYALKSKAKAGLPSLNRARESIAPRKHKGAKYFIQCYRYLGNGNKGVKHTASWMDGKVRSTQKPQTGRAMFNHVLFCLYNCEFLNVLLLRMCVLSR